MEKNTKLTRFKFTGDEKVTKLVTPIGTIKVSNLTDAQAEKILEKDPECRYLEKAETDKKATAKAS